MGMKTAPREAAGERTREQGEVMRKERIDRHRLLARPTRDGDIDEFRVGER